MMLAGHGNDGVIDRNRGRRRIGSLRAVAATTVAVLTVAVGLAGVLDGPVAAQSGVTKRSKSTRARLPKAPQAWKEHWFDHEQTVKLVDSNDDVAVFFDADVPREEATAWIAPFMTKAWRYTKATYGDFGGAEGRLFAVFHQGRYSGGHPSVYFDASHDNRNVTDCGPGPWTEFAPDIPSHEIGHIVEGANNGVHESPGFAVWKDSKWIELYQYDLYLGIGLEHEARRVFEKFSAQADDFPRKDSHWFRDFFHPAWRDHGKSRLMPAFFRLLAQHYPQAPENDGANPRYTREMNWGEFVHFLSGAAKKDLRPLARTAFGWPDEWEQEYQKAREEFAEITYPADRPASKAKKNR